MYGDPVFYNWMTFTEALGLDKSSECITEPLHGVRGTQRKFPPKFIENSTSHLSVLLNHYTVSGASNESFLLNSLKTRFRLSRILLDLQKYILSKCNEFVNVRSS